MSQHSDSTPVSGDAISELAQERRKLAQIESERPRPEFIEGVETSEVIYYFLPEAIPFTQIDVLALTESLGNLYKVQLKGPDISPLLATIPREQLASMTEFRTDDTTCKGGRCFSRVDRRAISSAG